MDAISYDGEKSNISSLSILQQSKFLPEVIKKLEKEPETVIKAMNELREICKSCTSILSTVDLDLSRNVS